uniref:SXP/RAL-2 protein n=1 Tax=Meloidogyne incognita TaxID=6306 RepID=Q6RUQ0_MELIC|nr:SXP/RAL-2 protein [Meloidogyne incognita]
MSKIIFSLFLFVSFFALTISFGFGGSRGNILKLLPPFIGNITREQIREYNQIVGNITSTKAQIKSELQNWAQNNGILQPYNNFTSQLQRDAEQFHDKVVQNLTGEALTLFNQIWSIRQDDTITRLAECQQIKNAYKQASPEVRQQVPFILPSILGPPPRGCCFPRPFSHSSSSEQQPTDNTLDDQQQDNENN